MKLKSMAEKRGGDGGQVAVVDKGMMIVDDMSLIFFVLELIWLVMVGCRCEIGGENVVQRTYRHDGNTTGSGKYFRNLDKFSIY